MKIITGGQSGGDLTGTYFALKYGIETEINTFKDFRPIHDKLPENVKINYVCDKGNYSLNLKCRTKYNVINSDYTIILLDRPIGDTIGSMLTFNYCKEYKKSCYYVDIYTHRGTVYDSSCRREFGYFCIELAQRHNIITRDSTVNIAGPRTLNRTEGVRFLELLMSGYIENTKLRVD